MIIGSWTEREIGKHYLGLSEPNGDFHKDFPYVVKRKATWGEWAADKPEGWNVPFVKYFAYFYEVYTD